MASAQDTIVSVTPMAVERDSRTYKQAASLARLGYRSVVVEAEASELPGGELPFELITVPGAPRAWGSEDEVTPGGDGDRPVDDDGARAETVATAHPNPGGPAPSGRFGIASTVWIALLRARDRFRYWLRTLGGFPRAHFDWNRHVYSCIPAAQLYIVHSYPLIPAVFARARKSRAPMAYDAHDAYFEIKPEQANRRNASQRTWELTERLCVWRSRGFSTVSEGVAGMLEERFGRRPTVIRNCHDLRLDRPCSADLRGRLELADDDFLLVTIGNYKAGMNVDEGLRALTQLPEDVHLAFVGRGHEANRARVSELGLSERVHLVRPVPPTEVTSFVRSASASLVLYRPLTRNYESALPNGFFQGFAAGLPTLYPTVLPELAALAERHGLGVPVDPNDPSSIAAAVSTLRSDHELMDRLRANAATASGIVNWEHEERRFLRFVENAMDGVVTAPTPVREPVG